jgi:hypothetical protein
LKYLAIAGYENLGAGVNCGGNYQSVLAIFQYKVWRLLGKRLNMAIAKEIFRLGNGSDRRVKFFAQYSAQLVDYHFASRELVIFYH